MCDSQILPIKRRCLRYLRECTVHIGAPQPALDWLTERNMEVVYPALLAMQEGRIGITSEGRHMWWACEERERAGFQRATNGVADGVEPCSLLRDAVDNVERGAPAALLSWAFSWELAGPSHDLWSDLHDRLVDEYGN